MVQYQMDSWGISEQGWRKGPWTHEEDRLLIQYVTQNGEGRWSNVSKCAGLNRSGKSCRLRWVNYLRPGLKKGHITPQEEGIIIELHALWGNKWSTIARYLPGRTDNEIKNYWRTHFKKRKATISDDDVQIKQQKRKFISQKKEEDTSTLEDKNSNQDTTKGIAYENKQYVPTTYQDSTNAPWSDFITVDSYLWDIGLWNFDDQSKMGIQNQDNNNIANYSCEPDAIDHYVHNGEFVF